MAATLDALNADTGGIAVVFVVQIEGYDTLICSSDPDSVLAAWQASPLPGHADVDSAVAGLAVKWEQHQQHSPWVPFGQPPMISLSVVAAEDNSGQIVDVVGETMLRRAGDLKTTLTASLHPASTTADVRSTAAFPGSGVVHCGSEALGYTSTTSQAFLGLKRGYYSPFHTSSGARFARSHKVIDPTSVTGDPIGVRLPPEVGNEQRSWMGRHVGVWICRRRTGRVVDGPDEAHLAFAGMIADVGEGEDGETVIECEHILRRVYETQLMASPYQATLAEGVQLVVGASNDFVCTTVRFTTSALTSNPLTIVAGTPASVNEIQEGVYTIYELGNAINAWLQAEYAAGRITFSVAYDAAVNGADGPRGVISFSDAGGTSTLARSAELTFPTAAISHYLGWAEELTISASTQSGRTGWKRSPRVPLRFLISNSTTSLTALNPRGEWVDQAALLPPELIDVAGLADGVVQIADLGHAVVRYLSDTSLTLLYSTQQLNRYLPSVGGGAGLATIEVGIDDDRELTVSQVILAQGTFKELLLQILFSTGSTGYNHPTYDTLADGISCGVPYELCGDDFVDDLAGVADADEPLVMILRKPTRFVDAFNVDFVLRWCFFTWGAGRVNVRAWGTPTVGNAVLAIDDEDKAVPEEAAATDRQRSTSRERFEFIRNMVTISWGQDVDGNLSMTPIAIADLDSLANHGNRSLELEARNTLANAQVGNFLGVVSRFGAVLPLFSRPHRIIRRTMGLHHFEQLVPGTFVTVTDRSIRDPDTGRRYDRAAGTGGLTGWPGIIVGNEHSWGGSRAGLAGGPVPPPDPPMGEVDVMIFDRLIGAPYSPAAQVDETATTGGYSAGYNSGTLTLKLRANEHSAASDPEDSSRFAVNDAIRIVEIDPNNAAAPTAWARTVSAVSTNELVINVALSSPSWDPAKLYRVIPDLYKDTEPSQRATVYQADDGDGLVGDDRQPYGMVVSGAGQANPFVAATAEELPARWAETAAGDEVPLDCAYARDAARLVNNMVSYKTAPQMPAVYSEVRTSSPTGTWELIEVIPVAVGVGRMSTNQTRKLYVAPQFRSKDGSAVTVRYTLARLWPQGTSRHDVTHLDPSVQASFTTTSTTFVVPTAVAIDIKHLNLAPGALGGLGWLAVEANNANTELAGTVHLRVGPVVTP